MINIIPCHANIYIPFLSRSLSRKIISPLLKSIEMIATKKSKLISHGSLKSAGIHLKIPLVYLTHCFICSENNCNVVRRNVNRTMRCATGQSI